MFFLTRDVSFYRFHIGMAHANPQAGSAEELWSQYMQLTLETAVDLTP